METPNTAAPGNAPKELTDRAIVNTPIGPVCMSRTEYEMYREELERRKAFPK